jgi:molecular chaperone GrpE
MTMTGPQSSDHDPSRPPESDDENLAAIDAALQDDSATSATSDGGQQATESPPEGDALQAELQQASGRILRLQAELENVRKRTAREMAAQHRYASLSLMRDLLPVLDNIRRAIEAAEKAPAGSGLLDGFRLVDQQLKTVLSQHHCTEIEALNRPFDPHLHDAISQQVSEQCAPGTIVAVTQAGYQLHDRVVRPSQVIVSSATPPEEPTAQ